MNIVLPRRAVPQPSPFLNSGGDCGACVLAGVLGLSPVDIYERWCQNTPQSLGLWEIQRLLRCAEHEGLLSHVVIDIPIWPYAVPSMCAGWGLTSWQQQSAWESYLAMSISGGYYGLATVAHPPDGPVNDGTNHWVLLCGIRHSEAHKQYEVLVSCSAQSTPNEDWISTRSFLINRGGFTTLLARPI